MTITIPEKDWKYLRSVQKDLLSDLCRRINVCASEILRSDTGSEHEKYLKLYEHIKESDDIIADCFNDWRRSNLWLKLPLLRRYELLKDEHISRLSDESRELLERFAPLDKG